MPRIAGKISGGMRINGKIVGGMRINGKIVDGFGDTPTPTTLLTINGRTNSSNRFVYSDDIVLNGVNYGRPTITQRFTLNDITFVFSSSAVATQFRTHSPSFRFRFGDGVAPFPMQNILGLQTGSTLEWDVRRLSPNTDYTLTFEPTPAPATLPATFDLSAIRLSNVAAGRLGGLIWQFTHNGRLYTATACFTHANGHQFRFYDNATALAFIAADLTVNSGITGQATYKTSVMENVSQIRAAQYRAFPGRYVVGTDYTVTISE